MRVNVYAEEMTDRVELIRKNIDGHDFTAIRFYLELPATIAGPDGLTQAQGPFIHRPGDDDSAAVTFWGKQDMRPLLRKALALLDGFYDGPQYRVMGKSPVESVLEELERAAIVALEDIQGGAKVCKFALMPEMLLDMMRGGNPMRADGKCRVVSTDLPADFSIRHVYWDHVNRYLVIVGSSESCVPVDLTAVPIPEIVPAMTVHYEAAENLAALALAYPDRFPPPADPRTGNDDAAGSHAKSGDAFEFNLAKQDIRELYRMIRLNEEAGDIVTNREDVVLWQIARKWNLEPRPKRKEGPQAHALLVFPGRARGRYQITEMLLTFDPEDGATEAARFCSLAYHEDIGINGLDTLNDANALLNDETETEALAAYGVATVNSCQPIFREIERERIAQDRQWGGATHDDSHERFEWASFIERQLAGARGASHHAEQFEQRMVKVAALAVAAVQSSRRCALLKA